MEQYDSIVLLHKKSGTCNAKSVFSQQTQFQNYLGFLKFYIGFKTIQLSQHTICCSFKKQRLLYECMYWCFKQKQQTGFNPDRDGCGWFIYTRVQMHSSQFEKPIPHRFSVGSFIEKYMPSNSFIWDETFCAEFQRKSHIWNWWIRRRDSKGQNNIFNYKLLEKRVSEMDSLLEEPYKPITQMCYKKHQMNLIWADWMHKMHAFVPIFHNSQYFTRSRTIVLFRDVNTDYFAQGKSKWFSKVLMKITLLSLVEMSEVTFLFMFHMNIVIVEFRNKQWLHIQSLKQTRGGSHVTGVCLE